MAAFDICLCELHCTLIVLCIRCCARFRRQARERKRAMQEGMAASGTKAGKAKKDKGDFDWAKMKSN